MYGEMVNVRARANTLREIANELRGSARTLSQQSAHLVWRSPAGDSFRAQLRGLVGEAGSHATELEEAARALERHASAVDTTKRSIQDAQVWVTARLNDAARAVREAGGGAVGAVEQAIASAARNAPTGGSKEWLDRRALFERRGWA